MNMAATMVDIFTNVVKQISQRGSSDKTILFQIWTAFSGGSYLGTHCKPIHAAVSDTKNCMEIL
jgi:hypothetical protein